MSLVTQGFGKAGYYLAVGSIGITSLLGSPNVKGEENRDVTQAVFDAATLDELSESTVDLTTVLSEKAKGTLEELNARELDLSPDGKEIVFTGVKEVKDKAGHIVRNYDDTYRTDLDIYVMKINGDGLNKLTKSKYEHHSEHNPNTGGKNYWNVTIAGNFGNPHWSPDGKYIAFDGRADDEANGNREIWVVNKNGRNLKRLTNTEHGSNDFVENWSSNNKIVYRVTGSVLAVGGLDGVFQTIGGDGEFYEIGVDGSGKTKLSNDLKNQYKDTTYFYNVTPMGS